MSGSSRDEILAIIVSGLKGEDYILAVWLEGADGTKSVDEYSDIDLVCYSKEGHVEDTVSRLDEILNGIGQLDIAYEQLGRPADNRYKVYHLAETPESLLLDVTFQSERFPVSFVDEDKTVVPIALIDKANILQFHKADTEAHRSQLRHQLVQAQGMYSQRSRAVKYTGRGLFLESLIYYQKYVLQPLVEVLRIIHTPFQADCFLVHATRDFPADVVSLLETLYGVTSVKEIAEGMEVANVLFGKAVIEAERIVIRERL
jgi:hypothetical protein